jgi:predicted lipoprotein with Yx(FWY)xxD motif
VDVTGLEQSVNSHHWMRRSSIVGLAIASALGAGAALAYTPPVTTPAEITLVDVSKLMDEGSPQFLWRRLGDAEGNPLYTSDADPPGKSNCNGECAKEFPPYLTKSGAQASGDWTIIKRGDHTKQWAYQGKPLYRYSGTDPRGEPQGGRFQLKEDPAWHDPGSKTYSPKEGWRRAAYTPEKTLVMPTSFELTALAAANGVGFVDAATHMTVYAAPASRKLSNQWEPVHAAALAVPVGEFSIVTRKDDGTRQWAYRGAALYTFSADTAPGEVAGTTAGEKDVQAALAYVDFNPAGVQLNQYPGRGPLMTTAKGQTLYTVARFHATYGGREALGGYSVSYNELKSQGTVGCQAKCSETWKPLVAPSNAQAEGFWEVIARPEGVRQWVFKGSPVYTFIGDNKLGDVEGNNRYVIVYGGPHGEVLYADAGTEPTGPKASLGNLDMAAAVGTKPGVKAAYLAGQGYIPERGEDGRGLGQVQAPRKAGGAAADTDDAGNGVGGSARVPDHGAGFYWHVIQVF